MVRPGETDMITSPKTRQAVVLDDAPAPTVMAAGIANVRHNGAYRVETVAGSTAASEKPPYRVPLMAELGEIEPNGYTVVSTFSGCVGSCLGFRLAGYRVLWASEFIDAAAETYAANHPTTPLDRRDIRRVTGAEILAAVGRERGDVDVLEGSPPCASFSTAGKRSAGWGSVKPYSDTSQRVDDLFFEYARLVDEIRPRAFVAENVSGLVKGVAKGYFLEILRALRAPGYVVAARLLDAQWLGVPQARQRIIFVGVRADLVERYGVGPAFPTPLPYRYSIRDALPEIAALSGRLNTGYRRLDVSPDGPLPAVLATGAAQTRYEIVEAVSTSDGRRSLDLPSPTVLSHGRAHTTSELTLAVSRKIAHGDVVDENVGASLDGYAIGDAWDRLKPGETSDRYLNLSRPSPDRPSPTVTATGAAAGGGAPGSTASVTHPTERRKFTIAELRRICGFPDDFVLTGTYAQQWERLGRAVPPPMMRAVADTLRDEILRRLRDDDDSA
jgi:DNA (cytosine-5)-methyltransferase 1